MNQNKTTKPQSYEHSYKKSKYGFSKSNPIYKKDNKKWVIYQVGFFEDVRYKTCKVYITFKNESKLTKL